MNSTVTDEKKPPQSGGFEKLDAAFADTEARLERVRQALEAERVKKARAREAFDGTLQQLRQRADALRPEHAQLAGAIDDTVKALSALLSFHD